MGPRWSSVGVSAVGSIRRSVQATSFSARQVVSADGAIRTDEAVTSSLAQRLAGAGARVAVERLAGADAPVLTAVAKAELRRATGAAAVDMESLIAGQYALEQRIPFAILRAVADPAERDLPPLVLKAVDSDGGINTLAVIGELIRSPGQLAGLRAARGRQRGRVPGAKPLSRPSSGPFPRPRSGGSLRASGRRSCRTRIGPRAGSRAGCPGPEALRFLRP